MCIFPKLVCLLVQVCIPSGRTMALRLTQPLTEMSKGKGKGKGVP